jgi:VWFA-related protein
VFAVATVAGTAGPGHLRAQEPGRAPTEKLTIHAVAVDRQGNPVTDLRREELEVWIGVYRVPIERLTAVTSSERGGRTIVLLLDDLTLPSAMAPQVTAIARRFSNRMTPGDRMSIVMLDGRAMELTDDPSRVLRALDAYSGGRGITPVDYLGEQVLESVTVVARKLAEVSGRKAIVAIGGAWLFDRPILPGAVGRDLRREWVEAIRAVAFADAHVYVVDPGGVGSGQADTGSAGFARETGGRAFANTNDFDGAVAQILGEMDNYYVIEVGDPPIFRTSDLRELDVRVSRRGVTTRARRWIPGSPPPQ